VALPGVWPHTSHSPTLPESIVQLEIWSDIACPWCAIGLRRLETALEAFPHRDEVEIRWRSFELDPQAPARVDTDGGYAVKLATKYGTDVTRAQAMIDQMVGTAAEDGWRFDFQRIAPGNTFDAHRLLHLAADHDVQHAVKERFLSGYLEEGVAIGDRDQLALLAVDAGLDPAQVAEVLDGDAYADAVRADEEQARAFGIGGVPFFVLDRAYAVEGAQPAGVLRDALDQAWSARRELQVVGASGAGGPATTRADHRHDERHDHGSPADAAACADGSCSI
jgi:predicted DsbA family dithiol-disulfide isomerase